MITEAQLRKTLIYCREPHMWAPLLSQILPEYHITSDIQVAMFVAQTGHESAHYNTLKENLNYSQNALRRVFRKYFPTEELAAKYARNPAMIASRVYANRMGNGDEASGDGWLYRGRGLIQVTGKNNYTNCSMFLFGDDRLLQDPSILLEPEFAIRSACWYWLARRLHEHYDDVRTVTKLINGGYNGLQDRMDLFDRAMRFMTE